jgi:hypothetical protein
MPSVRVEHLVGIVCPVPTRGHSTKLKPIVGAIPITMHCAVQDECWQAFSMRSDNSLSPGVVVYIRETLVVNDHVKSLMPIGLLIDRDFAIRGATALMHHLHLHMSPVFQTLREKFLLCVIVMTATATDEKHFKWAWRISGGSEWSKGQGNGKQKGGKDQLIHQVTWARKQTGKHGFRALPS